jgi:hypothetical protein
LAFLFQSFSRSRLRNIIHYVDDDGDDDDDDNDDDVDDDSFCCYGYFSF